MVDWNDKSIPRGKRKVAYVKWLMSYPRKVHPVKAKAMANAKFGGGRAGLRPITRRECDDWAAADAFERDKQMRGD